MSEGTPSTPDAGPTEAPPTLPPGWIAQWDSKQRKYYYVQISTGVSTWEVPQEAAPGVVSTPGPTPLPDSSQFQNPDGRTSSANPGDGAEGERGLGSTALHLLQGNSSSYSGSKPSSGISGLAQSFMGSGSHSTSSTGQGTTGSHGGLVGQVEQLASGLLGGNKPHGQSSSSGYGTSTSGSHSTTGGFLGSMLGGSHHSQQAPTYNYSSPPSQGGSGYPGSAPPAPYQQPNPSQQQGGYRPSSGPYNPAGYGAQNPHAPFYVGGQPPDQHHQYQQYGNQQPGPYGNQYAPPQGNYGGPQGYDQHNQYSQQGTYSNYAQPQQQQYGGGQYTQYGNHPQQQYGNQPPQPPPTQQQHQQSQQQYYPNQPQGYSQQQYPPPPQQGPPPPSWR